MSRAITIRGAATWVARQSLIELIGIRSSNVVSLEDLSRIHDSPHYLRRNPRLLSANQRVTKAARVARSLMMLPIVRAGELP
jgi:hypothetical protein